MARLDAESLISATSSLLLVRAELWRYALEKVSILLWMDSFGNSLECPYVHCDGTMNSVLITLRTLLFAGTKFSEISNFR